MDWPAWWITLAALVAGIAIGYGIAYVRMRWRYRLEFEHMRRSVLQFDDENKRLKTVLNRREVDAAVSYLD
jgi:hypothetical protein